MRRSGTRSPVHSMAWPAYDAAAAAAEEIEMAVQVNGKVRARISVAAEAPEDDVTRAALAAVAEWIEGREVKKVVVVAGQARERGSGGLATRVAPSSARSPAVRNESAPRQSITA